MRCRTITVEKIVHETDAALLLLIDDDERWVPKSVIKDAECYEPDDEEQDMEIAEWFCEREGL